MEESWKPVVGYEGLYEVSDLGRVRSLDRVVKGKRNSKWERKGRILQQANRGNGYYAVGLYKSGTQKMYHVHRLVAVAFIPNPFNKPCVNHLDENKQNNAISNLEWATHKENTNWGSCVERSAKASSKPVLQFTKAGEFLAEFYGAREAERATGVREQGISRCANRQAKTAGGFIWVYSKDFNSDIITDRVLEAGKDSNGKTVQQFTMDGQFIAEYGSTCEASRETGTENSGISRCANGKRKSAGGYIWRFKEI